jgi:imidazolonepropionase-like amidohydrolase
VERIDASGKYVYPGLIDAGTGLGLQEAGGMDGAVDNFELGPYNPHIEAYIGIDHTSEILGVQRVGGFTTVVTGLNGRGEPIPGFDSMIDLWGWTPQAMVVEKRIGLRINWNEDRAEDLKTYFLEANAYAARDGMFEAGNLSEFEWDVRMDGLIPVVRGEVPVIFEARSEDDIKSAVEFAEEMELSYLIRGGREAWKITEFLAEHDVKLLFSGVHGTPGRDEPYDVHYATPALLHEAGVDFAIYSGGVANVFSLTYEVGMAVAFGLPMDKALRSVTLDASPTSSSPPGTRWSTRARWKPCSSGARKSPGTTSSTGCSSGIGPVEVSPFSEPERPDHQPVWKAEAGRSARRKAAGHVRIT